MQTVFIEATNVAAGGLNWGKFMVGRWTEDEWARRAAIDGRPMLSSRGWTSEHIFVMDLQTGEGAVFRPGGLVSADLDKTQIWVCPLFEPFLEWLYKRDLTELSNLPTEIKINDPKSALRAPRRPGKRDEAEQR